MMAVAAGLTGFFLAFAGWRWGLRNRNWLEGGLVAVVAGLVCGIAANLVVKLMTFSAAAPGANSP